MDSPLDHIALNDRVSLDDQFYIYVLVTCALARIKVDIVVREIHARKFTEGTSVVDKLMVRIRGLEPETNGLRHLSGFTRVDILTMDRIEIGKAAERLTRGTGITFDQRIRKIAAEVLQDKHSEEILHRQILEEVDEQSSAARYESFVQDAIVNYWVRECNH